MSLLAAPRLWHGLLNKHRSLGPTVFLRDSFTDTNGTAIPSHTPDIGSAWSQNGSGAFIVQSGTLQASRKTDGDICVVNTGQTDCVITCDLTPYDNGAGAGCVPGLVFRYANQSNYFAVDLNSITGKIGVYKFVAGAFTQLATYTAIPAIVSGTTYTVSVAIRGNAITIYIPGNSPYTFVDSSLTGNTSQGCRVGVGGAPASSCTWDNFTVTQNQKTPINWPVFSRYGTTPVVSKVASTWENEIDNPDIFYDTPNSRWVMNYSGYDGSHLCTGLAYSTDLLTWTKEATNPVFSPNANDGTFAANGSIAYFLGQYWLYYQSSNIRCATSSDLKTWTRQNSGNDIMPLGGSGAFDQGGMADPMVRVRADGSLIMYYLGTNSPATMKQIGYATSTDGLTWTKHGPLFPAQQYANASTEFQNFGEPYHFVLSGSVWCLFFDENQCYTTSSNRMISMALSLDGGLTWQFRPLTLDKGSDAWENTQVFDPCVVYSGGTLYLFQSGAPVGGGSLGLQSSIGLCTASWPGSMI